MKRVWKFLPIIIVLSLLLSLPGFAPPAFAEDSQGKNLASDKPGGVITVDKQVEASSDDCFTYRTNMRLTHTCLFIDAGSNYMHTYLRFTEVDVPRGATIEHAYVNLCSDGYHGGHSYLRIYGIKEADTNTFSTQADADGRPVSDAYVEWTMNGLHQNQRWLADTWYGWTNDPHDIKDVIEEIVGQDGWQANNALAIKIVNTKHESNARCVYSWDYGDYSLAPKLHIEYSVANHPPVMTSATTIPDPAYTDDDLTAIGEAIDEDGDDITFYYQWKKNGTEISGETSQTLDSSNFARGDSITIVIIPDDGAVDGDALESDALVISNSAPLLGSIDDKTVVEGQLLQFTITASDPDGDPLTYSASNLPEGAGFAHQTFSWTPDYDQAGIYKDVQFEVSDGELTDSEDITITVNNVNLIPAAVIDSVNPNPAIEGELVSFSGHGDDSDGSIVACNWSSSIDGFLSNSSSFSTCTLSVGTHTISFKVKDNDDAWSQAVETLLTITSPPLPAIAFSPENFDLTATEGDSNPANHTLGIYNSGGGTLNWSVTDDDAGWLSLNPTSGSSTGETDNIALSVDTTGLSANTYTATITITASAADSPQTVPVTLTVKPGGVITVDKQVEASSDDCFTYRTNMRLTHTCLFIDECSNYMHTYLRFTNVNVPRGATIEHAYVNLCSDAYHGGHSYLRIYGIKEADTNTFSTQADADGRPVSDAYVEWTMNGLHQNQRWLADTWYGWTNDPHDIKDVIEEIVGQDGWQANNALAIKIVNTKHESNARCVYSWDYGDHSLAPKLHIEYSVGADT